MFNNQFQSIPTTTANNPNDLNFLSQSPQPNFNQFQHTTQPRDPNALGQAKKRHSDLEEVLKNYKKKKPTDRSLPSNLNSIESVKSHSKMYDDLIRFEKRLDMLSAHKRSQIQDSLQRPLKSTRKLRIFISNSASFQPWQQQNVPQPELNFESGLGIPSWNLKIEGRLLDANTTKASRGPPKKFSSLIKSMIVEFERDSSIYPDSNIVEWHKQPQDADHDGFEIKRSGDQPVKTRIILHMDHQPEKYEIAEPLSQLLGIKEDTRIGVISQMWAYIKRNNLLDKEDRRVIKADENLKTIFDGESIYYHQLTEVTSRFLLPIKPVVLEYIVQVNKDLTTAEHAYDINIDIEDPIKQKMTNSISTYLPNSESTQKISALDEEISQTAIAIRNVVMKRDFLNEFSKDSATFIKNWINSQSRDMDLLLGTEHAGVPLEDMRRADFYRRDWVNEAIVVAESKLYADKKAKLSTIKSQQQRV